MTEEIQKTKDVETNEDVYFRDMMLSEPVLAGLTKCNFEKPSPIQLRAIPIGSCGLDLMIQSKSGTGKTLVFCTIILERYKPEIKAPQSLIVVPTREIALQVEHYLSAIGSSFKGFSVAGVIGGRAIADDRRRMNKCKAIVGTPGRILHLIRNNFIFMQHIETFVLDEADKLVSDDFYRDINVVLKALNVSRQIIASSATYANGLDKLISSFMRNPIAISTSRDSAILIGVKQFILPVGEFEVPASMMNSAPAIQAMWRKVVAVEYILSKTTFKQCILFSNSQFRANSFANYLTQQKWTVDLVLGSHDQEARTNTLQKFRQYKSRILVTSDLIARGVDIVNVNLVINLDVPGESSTYLHRIGRSGRFGRRGLAITLTSDEIEIGKFRKMLDTIGGPKIKVDTFPKNLNSNTNDDVWNLKDDAELDDSNIFDAIDENDSKIKTEWNRNKNQKSTDTNQASFDVNKNESESIESKNLKLLEVAKLLIDDETTKEYAVPDLDEDLFSNFENSDILKQPEVDISDNLFDDFMNSQSNANAEELETREQSLTKQNEQHKTKLQHSEKSNAIKSLLEEQNIQQTGVTISVDLFEDFAKSQCRVETDESDIQETSEKPDESSDSDETLEDSDSLTDENELLAMNVNCRKNILEKQKFSASHKKTNSHRNRINSKQQNKHEKCLDLWPMNDFWIQTYWKQLSDIDQYTQNAHCQLKRKS